MRPERITLKQATAVWQAIRNAVQGIAKHKSFPAEPLPDIDMAVIFAGRKSMTAAAVAEAVGSIIAHIGETGQPSA